MKKLLKIVVALLVLTACSTDNKSVNDNQNIIPQNTVLVGKGDLYGNGQEGIEPQYSVIKNENQWEALKIQMNAVNPVTDGFSVTEVDFATNIVIAVFDEIRPAGGHSIDIIEVDENQDIVHVSVTKLLNGNMTAVMTQPYHLVMIPITDKEFVFN